MVKVSGKGRPSSQRSLFGTLTCPEKLLKYLFQEECCPRVYSMN